MVVINVAVDVSPPILTFVYHSLSGELLAWPCLCTGIPTLMQAAEDLIYDLKFDVEQNFRIV